ncbi:cytosol aminopeptidase-like [Adelges cooleyi]|uniref:cytosol aminopeptidase-like n=1 Tax=Adelges cooleyi TaxID=133065 RepID=UPI00217FADAD|nr:cytosol aminopeptidase-like [Adelges cooleyi]
MAYSDSSPHLTGLLLGVYRGCEPGEVVLTREAQKFDESVMGKASQFLQSSGIAQKKTVVAHNLHDNYFAVAFTEIGPKNVGYSARENLEQCLEMTRVGAGVGIRALQSYNVDEVHVESMSDAGAAAEGSVLGSWFFDGYRRREPLPRVPKLCPFYVGDMESWRSGVMLGEAQNLARRLSHVPPNIGSPDNMAEYALRLLCKCNVSVSVRDAEWIEKNQMFMLLNVAKGSRRSPVLLELAYCGGREDDKPAVLIGDGCTFDSWGLCLRDNKRIEYGMFNKCGGAAVIGIMKAASQLSLPLNINAFVPLYENKPSGMALKPSSAVKSFNGKTVQVHRTSDTSRMVLSDLIGYSQNLKPNVIINVASLSSDTQKYFNGSASVAFTEDDQMYNDLYSASAITGDRVVRGPLWDFYAEKNKWPTICDVRVVPHQYTGDAMAAAMFLEDFKPNSCKMLTLDVSGSAFLRSPRPEHYLRPGQMTGSPVRTVIQLLKQMTCPNDKKPTC